MKQTKNEDLNEITISIILYRRLAQMVKAMLAFGIFITHGLACYVAIDIAWTAYLLKKVADSPRKVLWEYVLRTVLVLITCKKNILNYET